MKKKLIYILVLATLLAGIIYYYNSSSKKEIPDKEEVEDTSNREDESEDDGSEDKGGRQSVVEKDYTIEAGKKLPDFTLKNLAGEEVSLSDYEDKIVLINFWATWCTWCDIEMPDLQKVDDENEDLVVLAVNVRESKSQAEEYIKEGGYNFQVLLDEDAEIYTNYLGNGFPNSYFADKEGIFIGRVQGAVNYEQINEILEDIRKGE